MDHKFSFAAHLKKLFVLLFVAAGFHAGAQVDLTTRFCSIHIDDRGWITSIKNRTVRPAREIGVSGSPSPLLCLYNTATGVYYYPQKARWDLRHHLVTLKYSSGATAHIRIEQQHGEYWRMTLSSLASRNGIDAVQWGPIHTRITNILGEMLGVARDTSVSGNYAVGLLSLDDITTGGPANTPGDIAPFEYLIHSPDPSLFPLPAGLREGQYYSIGGNGISDVAFYSHPEEYYRIMYGNAAGVDSLGRISVVQHALDRRKTRQILFSLMPRMEGNRPVHQQVEAIPGVDMVGSSVALWASPDSIALMTVMRDIVITEGLPYPELRGKWVKDPARYTPGVLWVGNTFDSAVSYTHALGFTSVEGWSLGEYYPDRADAGLIPIRIPFSSGRRPIADLTREADAAGIAFGLHTLQNFLQHGISGDVSPVPNDSLCYLQKRILMGNVGVADTDLRVDDPRYLDEIAGWEGHPAGANMVRIGKELIHYSGISNTAPYTLQHVKRGYWGTTAAPHGKGDAVYKLQTNCYSGLSPDIFLQDEYADYYARVFAVNGMKYIDFDGEEGLFYQGLGEYSAKRFYRRLFADVKKAGIEPLQITGATLSGGSWHYHSVWNVGGGTHLYDNATRTWGIEGKDLRNVSFGNYFPSTFGGNFGLKPSSTVQDYENIEAVSVGLGVTYVLELSEKSVESCPQKYAIFKAVNTWEGARAAGAFPRDLKRELKDPSLFFHLEAMGPGQWALYRVGRDGAGKVLRCILHRAAGY
ncbi:MAG TPA: hypothetical protein VGS79_28285 [Puia sp.]|nr:hypothetical protein [Puia sp.]